jgi:type IV pilus assembly protein PilB
MAQHHFAIVMSAVHMGLISSAETKRIEALKRKSSDHIGAVSLVYRIPRSSFYRAWAELKKTKYVNLADLFPNVDLISKVPIKILKSRKVVPIDDFGDGVFLAMDNIADRSVLDQMSRYLGVSLRPVVAEQEAIQSFIRRAEGIMEPTLDFDFDPANSLDEIITEAMKWQSSDVHFNPTEKGYDVSFRVHGHLQNYMCGIGSTGSSGLCNRIKVLSNLDISEQRLPQDGSFSFRRDFEELGVEYNIDIRVATIPSNWGEKLTLRLTPIGQQVMSLNQLGMDEKGLHLFESFIRRPHGIILLTGPTGSGKSTTLYASLKKVVRPEINIMTVEDPIENHIRNVTQIQVGGHQDFNFASALRSILRHDPDILMVGEIRDQETAEIAIKAAMTGHLILSSLHTNSAFLAISRLMDLGIEPFLIADSLIGVVAQRLVRALCKSCRKKRDVTAREAEQFKWDEGTFIYEKGSCARCNGKGYQGRVGLFEYLPIDEVLSSLISRKASFEETEAQLSGRLMTFQMDASAKVKSGLTTIEEVSKFCNFD